MMEIKNNLHWYQKWWGVVLIVLSIVVLLAALLFTFLTLRYWWQIKKGQGKLLQKEFYSSFNPSISQASKKINIKRSEVETSDDPFLGNPNAEVVIVEFVDYSCSNCKQSALIMKEVMKKYAYKAKLIIRDFPAESVYSGTTKLSELAYCAQQQDRFWQMHDAIFNNQANLLSGLSNSQLQNLSNLAFTDLDKLKKCLNSSQAKYEVNQDYSDALGFGVRGTPTFFINGQKVEGAVPLNTWEKFLKEI